jgi:hypothetical protein
MTLFHERDGPRGREVLLRPAGDPTVRRWTRPVPRPELVTSPEADRVLEELVKAGGTTHLTRRRAEHEAVHNLVTLGMVQLRPNPNHYMYDFEATITPAGRRYMVHRVKRITPMRKGTMTDGFARPVRLVIQATFPARREPMLKGALAPAESEFQARGVDDVLVGMLPRAGADGEKVGTFTVGGLACEFHKGVGKPAYVTMTGPALPVPFHMVVASWDDAMRKAQAAAVKFARGETPDEGLYMVPGVQSRFPAAFGGVVPGNREG